VFFPCRNVITGQSWAQDLGVEVNGKRAAKTPTNAVAGIVASSQNAQDEARGKGLVVTMPIGCFGKS
jgi:hypothetical protein